MHVVRNAKALWAALGEARARGRFACGLIVFGYPARLMVTPRYAAEGPRRSVAMAGVETRSGHWSILLQRYAQGCELPAHLDGRNLSNRIVWILLRKARKGGVTFVEGPCRSWLGGRVMQFDGGHHQHGVTRVEEGSRISLILQHGSYDATPARSRTGAPTVVIG